MWIAAKYKNSDRITPMADAEKPQLDKFRDLARELGADTSEAHFKDRLRRVATSKEKADGPRKEDGRTPEKGD
jgi:hypothetical protein